MMCRWNTVLLCAAVAALATLGHAKKHSYPDWFPSDFDRDQYFRPHDYPPFLHGPLKGRTGRERSRPPSSNEASRERSSTSSESLDRGHESGYPRRNFYNPTSRSHSKMNPMNDRNGWHYANERPPPSPGSEEPRARVSSEASNERRPSSRRIPASKTRSGEYSEVIDRSISRRNESTANEQSQIPPPIVKQQSSEEHSSGYTGNRGNSYVPSSPRRSWAVPSRSSRPSESAERSRGPFSAKHHHYDHVRRPQENPSHHRSDPLSPSPHSASHSAERAVDEAEYRSVINRTTTKRPRIAEFRSSEEVAPKPTSAEPSIWPLSAPEVTPLTTTKAPSPSSSTDRSSASSTLRPALSSSAGKGASGHSRDKKTW